MNIKKIINFVKDKVKKMFLGFTKKIVEMTYMVISNFEGIAILVLATIGLTAILAELPFVMLLPSFIDGAMVIPYIASSIILLMLYTMENRVLKKVGTCAY